MPPLVESDVHPTPFNDSSVARHGTRAISVTCKGNCRRRSFDLDVAEAQALSALAAPLTPLPRRAIALPTVRPGADGDQVVEAQERLDAAGAHLPVGGYYGAITARAVAAFQSRHHLPRTGVLGAATWRALLRYAPLQPSWAHGPPDSALSR